MAKTPKSTLPDYVTPPACDLATAPWCVGQCYLIRTVTYHVLGRLAWVGPTELVLEDASWVADSGRWHEALAKGVLSEVEPAPAPGAAIVGRGAIVDAYPWHHPLPRIAK